MGLGMCLPFDAEYAGSYPWVVGSVLEVEVWDGSGASQGSGILVVVAEKKGGKSEPKLHSRVLNAPHDTTWPSQTLEMEPTITASSVIPVKLRFLLARNVIFAENVMTNIQRWAVQTTA